MRYAGVSLEEYQKTYDKLRDAGEGNIHLEYLELMADQTRERFQKAFDAEDNEKNPK